tara:strand:- start:379 stop:609 length:231 start_codon:yes stop_codon:yes gene_type:complete
MALAVYLGLVLQKLLESLVGDIVLPLVTAPLPDNIKNINFNVYNMKLNRFITLLLSSLVALFVSFLFMNIVIRHRS